MLEILHRVGIKPFQESVYKALATREGLARWWAENTQGESQIGKLLKFRFSSAGVELGGFDITVVELQPGQQVLWQVLGGRAEWIGTRIHWELK